METRTKTDYRCTRHGELQGYADGIRPLLELLEPPSLMDISELQLSDTLPNLCASCVRKRTWFGALGRRWHALLG